MKLSPRQQHNHDAVEKHVRVANVLTEHTIEKKVMYTDQPLRGVYRTTDGQEHRVEIEGHIETTEGKIRTFYLKGIGPRTAAFVAIGDKYEVQAKA